MSTQTTNYNLVKPADNDTADIQVINNNMDIIDSKIKEVDNKASNITIPVTSVNGKTGAVTLNSDDIKTTDGSNVQVKIDTLGTNITNVTNDLLSHKADIVNKTDETKGATLIGMKPITGLMGDNVRIAIQNLFQFANDGKISVANAITAKGVTASPTETFSALATKIGQISTGKKVANGTIPVISNTILTVHDLSFKPELIIIEALYQATGNVRRVYMSEYGSKLNDSQLLVNDSNNYYLSPMSGWTIYNDGFSVDGGVTNSTYKWIAYE